MKAGSGPVRFVLAESSRDADLRKLVRTAAMPGRIGVSLEREPSFFAAADLDAPEHHTIVGLDSDDRITCTGTVLIRQRFLNGRPVRVGYLGQLRLDPSCAGRYDILRGGYRFFRTLHDQLRVAAYFTTIASDNTRATRLLEHGVPHFPAYLPLGELATVLIPVQRAPARSQQETHWLDAGTGLEPLVALLTDHNSRFQFAPAWSAGELSDAIARFNLEQSSFRLISSGGRLIAAAALWDQRLYKQAVVTRYPRLLSAALPVYNRVAASIGFGTLPTPNQPIPQGFVSHLASAPETLLPLLGPLCDQAGIAGITYMTLAFDARDPRLELVTRRFRPRIYRTRVYSVFWPDSPPCCPPDDRLMYPEAALL